MGTFQQSRVWRGAGFAALLVVASAIGPLGWGSLRGALAQSGDLQPVDVPITPFRLVDTRAADADPGRVGQVWFPNTSQ